MLVIFGLVTYATKGVSFGAIEATIPNMIIPKVNGFPTIILWAVAAIAIVWFIWNKTTFGKNLYAVGGNPEAAAVSGISVFAVTVGAFVMAGVLYGFGSWLGCIRMVFRFRSLWTGLGNGCNRSLCSRWCILYRWYW